MPPGTPELPLLLPPEELASKLGDERLLIVDLCQDATYQQVHVPGAVHLSPSQLVSGVQPATGNLPDPAALEQALRQIGLRSDLHVVAYDDEGGGWAGRLIWTLDVIGHTNYSYLDGGLRAWLDCQLPVSNEAVRREPGDIEVRYRDEPVADREYLLARLEDPELVIWDARSPAEYCGQRVLARKGGHIPGARNYEWTLAMDAARGLRMRDADAIRAELEALGITPDREIVTHCQTHHRSGFTYLVARILGYPKIRAYPGSWSEWGNDPDTPVAN